MSGKDQQLRNWVISIPLNIPNHSGGKAQSFHISPPLKCWQLSCNTGWRESGRSCSQRALTTHFRVSPPSFVYHGTADWRTLLRLLHGSHFHGKLLPVLHGILTLVLFFLCFELQKGEEGREKSWSGAFSIQNVEGKAFHISLILGNIPQMQEFARLWLWAYL